MSQLQWVVRIVAGGALLCVSLLVFMPGESLAAYSADDATPIHFSLRGTCCAVTAIEQSAGAFELQLSVIGVLPQGALGLPGEHIDWFISLSNPSAATGTDITVTDVLRDELRVEYVATSSGTYTIEGQRVVFSIPSLSPGATVTMQITTRVIQGPTSGSLVNRVALTGQGPDGALEQGAVAEVFVPTRLPETGYAPQEDFPGEGEPSALVIALIAFSSVAMTALFVWWRGQMHLVR